MMSKNAFRIYCLLVLGWMTRALLLGWTWTSVDEVKQVPKSVRDNPGSYRSHYSSYRPYRWGK
jgi:hypothetical protein